MERTSLLLIVLMLLVIVLIIALVVVTTEKDYQRTRMHQEIQSLQTPKRLVGKHMNILGDVTLIYEDKNGNVTKVRV